MWVQKWDVPSSDGRKTYVVAIDDKGKYGCSCPHWKFRKLTCKHIVRIMAQEISTNVLNGQYKEAIKTTEKLISDKTKETPIPEINVAAIRGIKIIPAQRVSRNFNFDD